ncbi:type II secretion system F family protein [Candidatus Woesearchaeota archaeon]|nr:type II secretion system F family protein [Candidatus Woesearchaeota archaeon]
MKHKFKKKYSIGIGVSLLLLLLDFFYFIGTRWFYSIIIVSLTVASLQFWIDFFNELKTQREIEQKFLEFIRGLVGTVHSGLSTPQAIVSVADEDFGALNPYINKLRNQLEIGIPLHDALITFGEDTDNPVIKRSIAIVIEAEKSGGDIEDVLESVVISVVDVKKMKEERKAGAYNQIVQGYIVFFVFIAIMLVLQLKLFPQLTKMSGAFGSTLSSVGVGILGNVGGAGGALDLDRIFLGLVLIQGLFAGIMIGKFSEGSFKQGLLHSLVLMILSTLVIVTVKGGI